MLENKHSLTSWIFVGMLVGILIGITLPSVGVNLDVISSVFLRLIKTIVAPLIFGTLVRVIARHSDSFLLTPTILEVENYNFSISIQLRLNKNVGKGYAEKKVILVE